MHCINCHVPLVSFNLEQIKAHVPKLIQSVNRGTFAKTTGKEVVSFPGSCQAGETELPEENPG